MALCKGTRRNGTWCTNPVLSDGMICDTCHAEVRETAAEVERLREAVAKTEGQPLPKRPKTEGPRLA